MIYFLLNNSNTLYQLATQRTNPLLHYMQTIQQSHLLCHWKIQLQQIIACSSLDSMIPPIHGLYTSQIQQLFKPLYGRILFQPAPNKEDIYWAFTLGLELEPGIAIQSQPKGQTESMGKNLRIQICSINHKLFHKMTFK